MVILLNIKIKILKNFKFELTFLNKLFGISRTENKDGYLIFNQIKDDIAGEIAKNGFEPSPEFIDEFCEKYDITIPNDIFFNFNF